MLSRHEEKYVLSYRQYLMLRQRALQVLTPIPTVTQVHTPSHPSITMIRKTPASMKNWTVLPTTANSVPEPMTMIPALSDWNERTNTVF